jgi:hypothetical protein
MVPKRKRRGEEDGLANQSAGQIEKQVAQSLSVGHMAGGEEEEPHQGADHPQPQSEPSGEIVAEHQVPGGIGEHPRQVQPLVLLVQAHQGGGEQNGGIDQGEAAQVQDAGGDEAEEHDQG